MDIHRDRKDELRFSDLSDRLVSPSTPSSSTIHKKSGIHREERNGFHGPLDESTEGIRKASPTNSSLPDAGEEEEFNIMRYISVLVVRKYWLLSVLAIVCGIVFWLNKDIRSRYLSYSRLSIKTNPIENAVGNIYVSDRQVKVSNHLENLRVPSEDFLEGVRKRIRLKLSQREIESSYLVDQEGNAELLLISVETSHPKLSRRLADVIASEYEIYDLKFRQRNFSEREKWIQEQLKKRKAKLNELESKIKAFNQEHPTFTGAPDITGIVSLETQIKELTLKKEEEEHRLSLINYSLSTVDSVMVAEVNRDQPLQKEMLNMELELAKLKVEYGEQSRKVKKLMLQIENIKKLISKNLQSESFTTILQSNPRFQSLQSQKDDVVSELSILETRKQELEKMIQDAYVKNAKEPELELRLSRMERDKIASEKIHNMLQEKLEETRLKKAGVSKEVYKLGRASEAIEIQKGKIGWGMALLVGFVLGTLLCFLIEQFDKTLKMPMEIEKKYGIPVLGIIPEMKVDVSKIDMESDTKILEPYRSLRTNLNYTTSESGKPLRSIIITSALQGEGKSTKAVNLAACFAFDGKKVLLVDSDLRRPTIHGLLNQERGPGLSEFLTAQASFAEVVKPTRYLGLSIVAAGNKMPNPAEILGSSRVEQFLKEAYKIYDYVFFDSPAIFPVSDALVLAPKMDGALVVFRSNYTPLKAGEDVLRKLNQVGASVIGGILNDVRSVNGAYYYSYYGYYGYYGYSYYQSYYEENHPNVRYPWLHAMAKNSKQKVQSLFGNLSWPFLKISGYLGKKILLKLTVALLAAVLVTLGSAFLFEKMKPAKFIPFTSENIPKNSPVQVQ